MQNQSSTHFLVLEKLSILFNTEKQFINYLKVIQNKSQSSGVQSLINILADISLSHLSRLNFLLKKLGIHPQGINCEAMNGLIRENLSLINHSEDNRVKEQAIINFLQQANRYKSTAYAWLQNQMTEQPRYILLIPPIRQIIHEEKSVSRQIYEMENALITTQSHEQLINF